MSESKADWTGLFVKVVIVVATWIIGELSKDK
jgi:hypothetical protein